MPLSPDERARGRQLANLRRGVTQRPDQPNLRHGAYAQVTGDRLEAKVAEVRDALAEDAPVKSGADTVVITEMAQATCRLEDVRTYIKQRGILDDDGEVRPVVDLERRLVGQVLDLADALGMTPRSRAKIGLDIRRGLDLDLAAVWAQDDGADRG